MDSFDGLDSDGTGAVDSIPIPLIRSRAFQRDVGRPASVRRRASFLAPYSGWSTCSASIPLARSSSPSPQSSEGPLGA